MRKIVLILVLCFALSVFALNKPSNYVASGTGGTRANQISTLDFAAWNITSGDWQNVIPPNYAGTVYGVVAIGNGLLAYGSISSINGNPAAGLAYYDGSVWAAPEGVGLFTFGGNYNTSFSYYDNIPSGPGVAYGAVAVGNTVYLYGNFDQVGLCRTGVAGLVALNWAAPGVFTVSQVGNGYYRTIATYPASSPCSFCPADSQPGPGNRNKFRTYSSGGNQYFVFQPNSAFLGGGAGDVWIYQVNSALWVQATYGNNALNITNKVNDYHVPTDGGQPALYVVGNFQRLNDPVTQNQYLHIAASSDNGVSFQSVTTALTLANFGDIPSVVNQTTGITISPALTSYGLTAIQIPNNNRNCIYVAGGYRVNGRTSSSAFANELQTVVFSITSSSVTYMTSRFGVSTNPAATVTGFNQAFITQLKNVGNNIYIYGTFNYYNQYIPEGTTGERFAVRYTDVYRGAAVLSITGNTVSPAFGGFLTAADTDAISLIPNFNVLTDVSTSNNIYYFATTPSGTRIAATYSLISSGILAYGGDAVNNANNRWNPIFGNKRIVTPSTSYTALSSPYPYAALPTGPDGTVYALHITQSQDALIFGGVFDFIGTSRVGGIGFYNPDIGNFGTVGGGLYFYNNNPYYQSDNIYNNRVGGTVYDITEWNGYLIAAGTFNRNNSGNSLSNIARIAFRVGGAGWIQIDGGCDSTVYDVLVQGNLLYATGTFSYCGLNSAGYTQSNGLNNGRTPTSKIAVLDLSLDPSVQSWRPLGIGLQSGIGKALSFYNGKLYVGGTFSSAGGVIASNGIASWDGTKWQSVVANCQDPCSRDINVLPYDFDYIPTAAERKPTSCVALTATNGNLYCVDSGKSVLAWWDGSLWHQAGSFTVSTTVFQNNIISNNGSSTGRILVAGKSSQNSAGNFNYYTFNTGNNNYEPTYTGFSNTINSIVSSNINN